MSDFGLILLGVFIGSSMSMACCLYFFWELCESLIEQWWLLAEKTESLEVLRKHVEAELDEQVTA